MSFQLRLGFKIKVQARDKLFSKQHVNKEINLLQNVP